MLKHSFFLLLLNFPLSCLGQESIVSILANMKSTESVQIAYQESREQVFFDDQWQGSGFLYATTPATLVKQQLEPDIEIMAAVGEQLSYLKPSTQTFHQLQLDESNPMMASLAAFKGLMTGDLEYLRQNFELKLSSNEISWKLTLQAIELIHDDTENSEVPLVVIFQGKNDQAAYSVEVILPDGDRSLYLLQQPQQGKRVHEQLDSLLHSLKHY